MMQKKTIIFTCLSLLSLICLSAFVLRYWELDRIPYGFHVDELSGSVDIGCLATEGVDAHNVAYPIFSNIGYGTPKPPIYIYPAILWSKAFGYNVASLRALSVTVHILGIIGIFFLARSFFGWPYAFLTMTVASLSPWTWNLSRMAFESLFSVTFLIWGMYFFFKLPKIRNIILAALFFAAAMYSYPPIRVQAPLMLLTLVIFQCWKGTLWTLRSWLIFGFTLLVPMIPLIQKIFNGEVQNRFNAISIFSKEYLISIHSPGQLTDIIKIFINNFILHFNADFLFLRGDPSYVHSTRHFGILSWLDMAALVLALMWVIMLLIKKNINNNPLILQKPFVFFLLANILIGVVPAALTNSELPNSLRITGAWPFMCLFSGFFIWQACESWGLGPWIGTCILAILFAVVFFNVYFKVFPQEGKGMFAYWTLEQVNELRTDEDWLKFVILYRYKDYTARYFLIQDRHMSCTQSNNMWKGINNYLKDHGNP